MHPETRRFTQGCLLAIPVSLILWVLIIAIIVVACGPRPSPTAYAVYLPLVTRPFGGKGLAAVNVSAALIDPFGVSWYYTWGETCSGCAVPGRIPMVKNWQLPTQCYPALMVGNEPELRAPDDFPMTPAQAVAALQAIEAMCPQTYVVAGNVSHLGVAWLTQFLASYPGYDGAIGVHCYAVTTADFCLTRLAEFRALYMGPMWVTEFNCLGCSTAGFRQMVQYAASNFQGYAPYTNREPGSGQPWEIGPASWLVATDGTLTANGQVYADW